MVEVDVPLAGDVDLGHALSIIPAHATIKGMFCARFVTAIDEPWEEISDELAAPPKDGRYTAFEDYPIADYVRLLDRAARNRFPRSSTREAYRLLGRGDVEVFADSTLGKVTFSLLKDPAAAVERYAEIVGVLSRETIAIQAKRSASGVTLVYPRFIGVLEATIGHVEALVQTFDARPRTTVAIEDDGGATFDITWT